MKKSLLLLIFLPLFASAQVLPYNYKFAEVLLSSRNRAEPGLRSSPFPDALLDSTHLYDDRADMLLAKYTYEFDGAHIMNSVKKAYSSGKELYQVKSSFSYEPRKYFWIEQIDSIFEFEPDNYTTKTKYTRTYNEEAYMTEYKEYYSMYDSPWGRAMQTFSAIEFNEENMPIIYMDTLNMEELDPTTKGTIVHKWEVTYNRTVIESMTGYIEVENNWLPEIKFVISDELWPKRTIDVLVKMDDSWSQKVGEVVQNFDGRDNLSIYKIINEKNEIDQSFRFKHFYADGIITHSNSLNKTETPKILVNNSDRSLTIDLGEELKGEITIINATGRVVKRSSLSQSNGYFLLNDLKSGYYIICIQTDKQYLSQPVILR